MLRVSAAEAKRLGLSPKKRRPRSQRTTAKTTAAFEQLCVAHGLPEPVPEFCFAPPRQWRFDWAWPEARLALEIEGGAWTQGRHTRGAGFVADLAKYNAAAILGWRVLRCTPDDVKSGAAFALVKEAMKIEDRGQR